MFPKPKEIEYRCPKCDTRFSQVPDNIYFHFECRKCNKEYGLDGVTPWINPPKRGR